MHCDCEFAPVPWEGQAASLSCHNHHGFYFMHYSISICNGALFNQHNIFSTCYGNLIILEYFSHRWHSKPVISTSKLFLLVDWQMDFWQLSMSTFSWDTLSCFIHFFHQTVFIGYVLPSCCVIFVFWETILVFKTHICS